MSLLQVVHVICDREGGPYLTNPIRDAKYRLEAVHVNSKEVTLRNVDADHKFKVTIEHLIKHYNFYDNKEPIKNSLGALLFL